ncbi:MAG: hypothetical protein ACTSQJ_09655 [Promethearchaeota archaeon]
MKVGFSEIIITPELKDREKPLQLGGYSPRKFCSGIHDNLYARAVYFESNNNEINKHVLMIVCDILSIDGNLAIAVKNQISKKIPIKVENILISATHTHHGPDYKGIFRPGSYLEFLKGILFPMPQIKDLIDLGKKLIEVALNAYKNKKNAKIGAYQTIISESKDIILNRRHPFNFDKLKYPLTVLKIISDEEIDKGKLYGLIINYACHGTALPRENTLITADYIGYIIKTLENKFSELKGNFLYFNGPCGEINPLSFELKRKIEDKGLSKINKKDIYQQKGSWHDAEYIGKTIANNVIRILDKIECEDYNNNLNVLCRNVRIPIKDYHYGSDLKSVLNRLIYKKKLNLINKLIKIGVLKSNIFFNIEKMKINRYIETIVQIINIGNVIIATIPGEYFMELGNEIIDYTKSVFPSNICFIVELSNDSIGYLYTIEAYLEGGYESAFSIIPLGGRFITMKLKQFIRELKVKN